VGKGVGPGRGDEFRIPLILSNDLILPTLYKFHCKQTVVSTVLNLLKNEGFPGL
jgi:hypothetical protein